MFHAVLLDGSVLLARETNQPLLHSLEYPKLRSGNDGTVCQYADVRLHIGLTGRQEMGLACDRSVGPPPPIFNHPVELLQAVMWTFAVGSMDWAKVRRGVGPWGVLDK
jgi:hypothetical protein